MKRCKQQRSSKKRRQEKKKSPFEGLFKNLTEDEDLIGKWAAMMGMDQPVTREQIEEEIRGEPIRRRNPFNLHGTPRFFEVSPSPQIPADPTAFIVDDTIGASVDGEWTLVNPLDGLPEPAPRGTSNFGELEAIIREIQAARDEEL